MKYITVVTLILLIHVSAAFINALGFTSSYGIQTYQEAFVAIDSDVIKAAEYSQSPALFDANDFGIIEVVKGFFGFIGYFAWGIVAVPYTLRSFGLNFEMALLISYPIYLIYLIAIVQIISNRPWKTMV